MNPLFGYDWEDIQRAQQGGRLGKPVDTSKPVDHAITQQDRDLLAAHGAKGLKRMGYHGTIDRLTRTGLITEENVK